MRIGIWLEVTPFMSWEHEGLTRLLLFVLEGINPEREDEFVLIMPYWVPKNEIQRYLSTLTPAQRARVKVRQNVIAPSIILRAMLAVERQAIKRRAKKRRKVRRTWGRFFRNFSKRSRLGFGRTVKAIVSGLSNAMTTSPLGLIRTLLLLPVLAVAGLLGLALAIVGAIIYLPFKLVLFVLRMPRRMAGGMLGAMRKQPDRKSKAKANAKSGDKTPAKRSATLGKLIYGLLPVRRVRNMSIALYLYLLDNEYRRMVRKLNSRRSGIDTWFLPSVSYMNGQRLKGPKTVLFADFVIGVAPAGFPPGWITSARYRIRSLLRSADKIIAISHHVAESELRKRFRIPEQKIEVVPHGFVNISGILPYLKRGQTGDGALKHVDKTRKSRARSAKLIRAFVNRRSRQTIKTKEPIYSGMVLPYLREFRFEQGGYILISTQNRPYKNTMRVIEALETYNRKFNRSVKLIMTGDYGIDDKDNPLGQYIRESGLIYDVLALPRVPSTVHAALYHNADLAIHASFYEGGQGAFPFSEALSVGTPALLAINRANDELYSEFSYEEFAFHPHSTLELVNLLQDAYSDLNALYEKQFVVASALAERRSWANAHEDYVDVFKAAAGLHRMSKQDEKLA